MKYGCTAAHLAGSLLTFCYDYLLYGTRIRDEGAISVSDELSSGINYGLVQLAACTQDAVGHVGRIALWKVDLYMKVDVRNYRLDGVVYPRLSWQF